MREDFIDNLKQTITDTVEIVGKKTENFVENQKIQSRIRSAKRNVDQNYKHIGEIIFSRFVEGEEMDEELSVICDEIMKLQEQIAHVKEMAASRRDRILCPLCGSEVPKEAVFCMKCGAPMPKERAEEEDYFTAGPVQEENPVEEAEVSPEPTETKESMDDVE